MIIVLDLVEKSLVYSFKGLNKEQATQLVENIKQKIQELKIEHEKNTASKYLTASFGLIIKDAASIKDVNELYRQADELLYQAKDNGRNKVCVNN